MARDRFPQNIRRIECGGIDETSNDLNVGTPTTRVHNTWRQQEIGVLRVLQSTNDSPKLRVREDAAADSEDSGFNEMGRAGLFARSVDS
jgi:hypothetical protein